MIRAGIWESWAGYLQRFALMIPLVVVIALLVIYLGMAAMFLAGREPFPAVLSAIASAAPLSAAVLMAGRLLEVFGAEAWFMVGGSAALAIVTVVGSVCLIDRDLCRD